jgi:hypothetical protein
MLSYIKIEGTFEGKGTFEDALIPEDALVMDVGNGRASWFDSEGRQ